MSSGVFYSILETFIIFGIGAAVRKAGMLNKDDVRAMSKISLELFCPMLTFSAITRNFRAADLLAMKFVPFIGVGIVLTGMLAGHLFVSRLRSHEQKTVSTFKHLCATNNYLFLPLIVLQQSYGEEYVAILMLMSAGSAVAFWTLGIMPFAAEHSRRELFRRLFTPNSVATVAALVVASVEIPIPGPLDFILKYLGDITAPLILVATGALLLESIKFPRDGWHDMALLLFLRLIVLPAAAILLLRLFHLAPGVATVAAVVAAMPSAVVSTPVAMRYGGDDVFAGRAVLCSTLLALLTVPVMIRLNELLYA